MAAFAWVWLGMRQPPRGLIQLANMLLHRLPTAVVFKAIVRFIHILLIARRQRGGDNPAARF